MTKRPAIGLLVGTALIVVVLAGHSGWDIPLRRAGDAVTPTPSAVIVFDAFMPFFLQFDGVYYLRVDPHHGRSLTEQDLGGRLGQVRFQVPNDASMINRTRDGDATVLEAGDTPLRSNGICD